MPARRNAAIELWLLGAFAACLFAYWWQLGVAREVIEPHTERVGCVSYSPFRLPGESPYVATLHMSRKRIEADLSLIATKTDCVRTYSVAHGLDQVPSVARELGMQVLLGAWLGRDRDENAIELERAIALARSEPATVRALIVGNEVLLRGDLSPHELGERIEHAKRALDIPVTYADVWEFWLRHPQLAGAVDFVTVHVLPYWEDRPVAVEDAVAHVFSVLHRVQRTFPGREILLGETGWPRAGRERREAVPGRVEQARFIRGFVCAVDGRAIRYNLIEAFDQPWKRRLEGAMGGYWGLFDRHGDATFPWNGPVEPDPGWREGVFGMAAGAAAFTLFALLAGWRGRRTPGRRGASIAALSSTALAGAWAGGLLVAQWRHAVQWNQNFTSAAPAIVGAGLTLVYAWLALGTSAASHGTSATSPAGTACTPGLHAVVLARLGRAIGARPSPRIEALSVLRFIFLFAAAMSIVLLVFDPRYRGFPWATFALPLGVALLQWLHGERMPAAAREERTLCIVIAAGAALVLALETVANREALAYCLGMLLYAATSSAAGATRTSTSSASSAPSADSPNE